MLKLTVCYTNLIRVGSIFAIFYAVFPQAVLEKPLPMRVRPTPLLGEHAIMGDSGRYAGPRSATLELRDLQYSQRKTLLPGSPWTDLSSMLW